MGRGVEEIKEMEEEIITRKFIQKKC